MFFAYLARIFTIIVWGISFPAAKIAVKVIPVEWLLFMRFLIAAFFLGFFLLLKGYTRPSKGDLKVIFFLILLQPVGYFLFETYGVKYTTPSNAATLVSMVPILVVIFGYLTKMEKISLVRILGMIVSFVGAYLVIDSSGGSKIYIIGDLLVLGAVVCAAVKTIAAKKILERVSPLVLTTYQFFFGTVFLFPIAMTRDVSWLAAVDHDVLLSILFLGVVCSGLAYLALHYSLAKLSMVDVIIMGYLIPVVSMIAQWVMLGIGVGWTQIIAMVFILAGVALVQAPTFRKKVKSAEREETTDISEVSNISG